VKEKFQKVWQSSLKNSNKQRGMAPRQLSDIMIEQFER